MKCILYILMKLWGFAKTKFVTSWFLDDVGTRTLSFHTAKKRHTAKVSEGLKICTAMTEKSLIPYALDPGKLAA
jgi:hypothetical protein